MDLVRLVQVGASYAAKITYHIEPSDKVTHLALPSQAILPGAIDILSNKIHDLDIYSSKATFCSDPFSSTAYMGSDESGMSRPAFQAGPGCFHLRGCLEVAPEAVLRLRFNTIRPLMEAAGEAALMCMLPIPRYVMK